MRRAARPDDRAAPRQDAAGIIGAGRLRGVCGVSAGVSAGETGGSGVGYAIVIRTPADHRPMKPY